MAKVHFDENVNIHYFPKNASDIKDPKSFIVNGKKQISKLFVYLLIFILLCCILFFIYRFFTKEIDEC